MAAKSKQSWPDGAPVARPLNGMHGLTERPGTPVNGNMLEHQSLRPPADESNAQPSNAHFQAGQGQAQGIEDSREPGGQAPTELPEELRQRDDNMLAAARAVNALRSTLSFADKGPWPEPQRRTDHWSFVLQEVKWLATDIIQEGVWKRSAAKALGDEAARFDRMRLVPAPGRHGEELRAAILGSRDDVPKRTNKKSTREQSETRRSKDSFGCLHAGQTIDNEAVLQDQLGNAMQALLTYRGLSALQESVHELLVKVADRAVISREMDIWKHNHMFQKSLQEAREQALAARKQLTAEIRGCDRTPILDLEETFGKQPKRRKARNSYDEPSVEPEISLPAKRVSTYRKQPSRPVSGISDEARRDLDVGVETSGRRERESKRKRKKTEYEDDDYEEPHRIRDPKSRRPLQDKSRPGLRTDPRSRPHNKRASNLGGRQTSRHLDPESVLFWSQQDDRMLCCIVHEFGGNWLLVSDILSSSMRMSGIRRSALQCKARFFDLAAPHFTNGEEIDTMDALNAMHINKIGARETIGKSLPVPDAVLVSHQKVLHTLCLAQREKRIKAREQEKASAMHIAELHPTVIAVERQVLQQSSGRHLTAVQIADANDAQVTMQAAAQQQAAQAAAAAPPVAPGMSGGPAVAHSPPTNNLAQHPAMHQAGAQGLPPAHLMQQPGALNTLQGLPSMGGIARTVSANGVAPTGFPIPQAQAMPPPAAVNQVSRPLNIAQMQEMLRTGKAPGGQDLTPQQRQTLVSRIGQLRARSGFPQGVSGSTGGRPQNGVPFQQAAGMGRPVTGMQGPQIGMASPMANAGGNHPGMQPTPGVPMAPGSQMLAQQGMQNQTQMSGHMQGHSATLSNQNISQLQNSHLNHTASPLPGQAQATPTQLQASQLAGVGSPSIQGQQVGGMPGSLPAHLAGALHGHTANSMASHLPARAYPSGYASPGQLQSGVQGMMARPMSQRPPLPQQVPRPATGLQAGETGGWPHGVGQSRMQSMPASMGMQMGPPNGIQPDILTQAAAHQQPMAIDQAQGTKNQRPHMSLQPGVTHMRPPQQ